MEGKNISDALSVVGRLEYASQMTASAFSTIFLKNFISKLKGREGGVHNALTHRLGEIEEGQRVEPGQRGCKAITSYSSCLHGTQNPLTKSLQ